MVSILNSVFTVMFYTVRSYLHMFQRIFKSTKFALYLYMFIFTIEQDIWVTRLDEILKYRNITQRLSTNSSYSYVSVCLSLHLRDKEISVS
jgi:hypothetical protein